MKKVFTVLFLAAFLAPTFSFAGEPISAKLCEAGKGRVEKGEKPGLLVCRGGKFDGAVVKNGKQ